MVGKYKEFQGKKKEDASNFSLRHPPFNRKPYLPNDEQLAEHTAPIGGLYLQVIWTFGKIPGIDVKQVVTLAEVKLQVADRLTGLVKQEEPQFQFAGNRDNDVDQTINRWIRVKFANPVDKLRQLVINPITNLAV